MAECKIRPLIVHSICKRLSVSVLVYRSAFLFGFLGVWLIINGFAYLAMSLTGLLLPQYRNMVANIAFPVQLGEIAFIL